MEIDHIAVCTARAARDVRITVPTLTVNATPGCTLLEVELAVRLAGSVEQFMPNEVFATLRAKTTGVTTVFVPPTKLPKHRPRMSAPIATLFSCAHVHE